MHSETCGDEAASYGASMLRPGCSLHGRWQRRLGWRRMRHETRWVRRRRRRRRSEQRTRRRCGAGKPQGRSPRMSPEPRRRGPNGRVAPRVQGIVAANSTAFRWRLRLEAGFKRCTRSSKRTEHTSCLGFHEWPNLGDGIWLYHLLCAARRFDPSEGRRPSECICGARDGRRPVRVPQGREVKRSWNSQAKAGAVLWGVRATNGRISQ